MSMEKSLVKQLLRCVQSPEERFNLTVALTVLLGDYPILGQVKGKSVYVTAEQKERMRQILRSERINPETDPNAWDGLTRSEALDLGNNEKFASDPVRRRRVAVKALFPHLPVYLGGSPIYLPARCHIEIDSNEVNVAQHDWLVVVENWEAFQDIHVAGTKLKFPGTNPLIVWRGGAAAVRADAMLEWVTGLEIPVSAFVDLDPAGLLIAGSLPRFSSVVSPGNEALKELFAAGHGRCDLYETQIARARASLAKFTSPEIVELIRLIVEFGKGLPQEYWLSTER